MDNKAKGIEGSKAKEFSASKRWFDNFKNRFGLINIKMIREAASANQEAAEKFPEAIKKVIEEKRYLSRQVFNAYESALFWKKKECHKGHLWVKKRSEHQNLRQKEVG